MTTHAEEMRREVLRRVEYARNVHALRGERPPRESLFDTAVTNALVAIVAYLWPGEERDWNGRNKPATELLRLIESREDPRTEEIDVTTLMEGVLRAQPFRHGRADDEEDGLLGHHIDALEALDEHPALRILDQSRGVPEEELYRQAFLRRAEDELPGDPKDRLLLPDPEECEQCLRPTFLREGWDMFGGDESAGRCIACGFTITEAEADDRAIDSAIRRAVERSD